MFFQLPLHFQLIKLGDMLCNLVITLSNKHIITPKLTIKMKLTGLLFALMGALSFSFAEITPNYTGADCPGKECKGEKHCGDKEKEECDDKEHCDDKEEEVEEKQA